MNTIDIEHEDYLASLPREVPVPAWVREDEDVTLPLEGKVTGHVSLRALLPNDVIVNATLIYRGNEYLVRWEHTTDEGMPYFYDQNGNDRRVLGDEPVNEGFVGYRMGEFLGGAPATFRAPLLAAVKSAVLDYLAHNRGHVRKCREANLIQRVNGRATTYNNKAEEAAKALDAYEDAVAALERFQIESIEGGE